MSITIEQLRKEMSLLKKQLMDLENMSKDPEISNDMLIVIEYKTNNLKQQIDLVDDLIILKSRIRVARDETDYDSPNDSYDGGYTGGDTNFNDGDY